MQALDCIEAVDALHRKQAQQNIMNSNAIEDKKQFLKKLTKLYLQYKNRTMKRQSASDKIFKKIALSEPAIAALLEDLGCGPWREAQNRAAQPQRKLAKKAR